MILMTVLVSAAAIVNFAVNVILGEDKSPCPAGPDRPVASVLSLTLLYKRGSFA